jgi:hypothetical protein
MPGITYNNFLGVGCEGNPCGEFTCNPPEVCDDLATCGPGGADLSDADFEIGVSGVTTTNCTGAGTGCSALNDTFLFSAPQITCPSNDAFSSGSCGIGLGIQAPRIAWAIRPPGDNNAIHDPTNWSYPPVDASNWRVEVFMGFDDIGLSESWGDFFALWGDAGLAAVVALCSGGQVTLPHVEHKNPPGGHSGFHCDASGATVTLQSIFP